MLQGFLWRTSSEKCGSRPSIPTPTSCEVLMMARAM